MKSWENPARESERWILPNGLRLPIRHRLSHHRAEISPPRPVSRINKRQCARQATTTTTIVWRITLTTTVRITITSNHQPHSHHQIGRPNVSVHFWMIYSPIHNHQGLLPHWPPPPPSRALAPVVVRLRFRSTENSVPSRPSTMPNLLHSDRNGTTDDWIEKCPNHDWSTLV